jgi:hypothetical protein
MNRERWLKIVLGLVGLLFLAGAYPLTTSLWQADASVSEGDKMMLSIYVTLGVFPLLAARNSSANRGLIAFTTWPSFAHAVYVGPGIPDCERRPRFLIASAVLAVIGVASWRWVRQNRQASGPPRPPRRRTLSGDSRLRHSVFALAGGGLGESLASQPVVKFVGPVVAAGALLAHAEAVTAGAEYVSFRFVARRS